jgi:hypothetical protein
MNLGSPLDEGSERLRGRTPTRGGFGKDALSHFLGVATTVQERPQRGR